MIDFWLEYQIHGELTSEQLAKVKAAILKIPFPITPGPFCIGDVKGEFIQRPIEPDEFSRLLRQLLISMIRKPKEDGKPRIIITSGDA